MHIWDRRLVYGYLGIKGDTIPRNLGGTYLYEGNVLEVETHQDKVQRHGPALIWTEEGTVSATADGAVLVVMTKEGQDLLDVGYTLAHIRNMTPADQVRFIHKQVDIKDFLKYLGED